MSKYVSAVALDGRVIAFLSGALELFNQRGSAAVTTNHVAARAGIRPASTAVQDGLPAPADRAAAVRDTRSRDRTHLDRAPPTGRMTRQAREVWVNILHLQQVWPPRGHMRATLDV